MKVAITAASAAIVGVAVVVCFRRWRKVALASADTLLESNRIRLHVGGEVFLTTISTLTSNSSYFANMFSGPWSEATEDEVFIDRDADAFRVLLSCMRSKSAFLPGDPTLKQRVLAEAAYFGVDWLTQEVQSQARHVDESLIESLQSRLAAVEFMMKATSGELVHDWMRRGLVAIGVSTAGTAGQIIINTPNGHRSISPIGSGFVVDERGLVFTCEHVRSAARAMQENDRRIVVAIYSGEGPVNWQECFEASVLARTAFWDGSDIQPPIGIPPIPGNADASVLQLQHLHATGAPVQTPVTRPGSLEPIGVMPLGGPADIHALERSPQLFALGFPPSGGHTPTYTQGTFAGTYNDTHGQWLKVFGLIMAGHSGGPVLNVHGVVIGWNVRTPVQDAHAAGLMHLRAMSDGQPCIDAALQML